MLCTMVGCSGRINYALPQDPIEFHTGTFVNPADADDGYLSFEYNGRTYIMYGTLKGRIGAKDVGECLGYIVQDGEKMEDVRVFLLNESANADYLVEILTEGFMQPPVFFRAVDTAGKEIYTPVFIDDLDYEFWQ